ncbi:MAG: MmcQ/YjbR family DNA-binding protein, partial [Clostridia bacterium]|nr:MmcQ/YjbR family DNA-binding protein [Clostridia bacterium]
LAHLWAKFPSNAIWRRKDNQKWYGILLLLSKRKLGLEGDEIVEMIDLRIEPSEIDKLVDGKTYFAGYHMNKRSWFTICLDGSVPTQTIFEYIDNSYRLALKK